MEKNFKVRAAVDIGGTFTDLIYFKTDPATSETSVVQCKVDTTLNVEEGLLNSIEKGELKYDEIDMLIHGSTVVINALTQRKGARTALITSEGFRDVLEIGRGNRPDFFNPLFQKPKCFVERYLRREVPGVCSFRGEELQALDLSGVEKIVNDFKEDGV